MKNYFELQFVMNNRKIKEAGLNPVLGYLLLVVVFIVLSEVLFQKTSLAKYILIFLCFSFQLKLSDTIRTDFLLSTFGDRVTNYIRITENLLICLPFASILVYKGLLYETIFTIACSVLLAFLTYKTYFQVTLPTPFSKKPYEFTVGFRKTFLLIAIAYVITGVAIQVDNLHLGIFSFLLIFTVSLSYFSKPEQDFYVWIHAETPRQFLYHKLLRASIHSSLLVFPVVLSLLIVYPSEYSMISLFYLLGLLFLSALILAKYSIYPEEMHFREGFLLAFCLYFPLLLVLVIPFFYFKSLQNLKNFLHDTH